MRPTEPITLEVLVLTECSDDNLARNLVLFDPDDIDGAIGRAHRSLDRIWPGTQSET